MGELIPYILYFFIYSFIGYVIEVIYCSIAERKVVSRGFLFGPILPIYGFGMVAVLWATQSVKDNLAMTFLVSMALCSVIEYFTSWFLEKMFGVKWWDYTGEVKYQLNGRICLQNSLMFGIAGCIIVNQIQPVVEKMVSFLGPNEAFVALILFILLLFDTLISVYTVSKVKSNLTLKLGRGDQTNEIKRLARGAVLKVVTGKNKAERKVKQAKKAVKKKRKEITRKIKNLSK